MGRKVIPVTSPLLPPLEEFLPYLEEIWESKFLTNVGKQHQTLEKALCDYLGVEYISLFANGTLALITAMQSLRISGEVITTPYSFVATSHALKWNGVTPVFVDIDPQTLNLDPRKIESAITSRTTAILPVHCYGTPCDVAAIQNIADKYNLKVIYDAAHAFGVEDKGGSILRHGDLSILSFHATKVFNTFEGGAVICSDEATKKRLDHLKNFGFQDEVTVLMPGINAKLNEVSCAFGLLQLKHIDQAISQRKEISSYYRYFLEKVSGIRLLEFNLSVKSNYAYFPIVIEDDFPIGRDDLYNLLRAKNVHVRRYFYPLISDFSMYNGLDSAQRSNLPEASNIAQKVLCLPIYPDLEHKDVEFITGLISNV